MTRARKSTFANQQADPLRGVEKVKPNQVRRNIEDDKIYEIGKASGFNARAAEETASNDLTQTTFDARSLRKSMRTAQLNIAIHPATKDRFWEFAVEQGVTVGEDALLKLFELADA